MAEVRSTVAWTLECLRARACANDRASAILLSSIVRTWGHELGLLAHGVTHYARTYADDTTVAVLSLPGGGRRP